MSADHATAGSDPDPEVLAKIAALAAALGDTITTDHSQLRGILNDTMPGYRRQVESTLAFLRAHPDAWKDPPSALPTGSAGGTNEQPGESSSTRSSASTDHALEDESLPLTATASSGTAADVARRSRAERVPWLHRLRRPRNRRVLLAATGVVVVAGAVLLVFLFAIPAYQSNKERAKYASQLEDAFPDVTSSDFNCGSVQGTRGGDFYYTACEMAARPARGTVTFYVATSQESAASLLRDRHQFFETTPDLVSDWAPDSVDDEQSSYGTSFITHGEDSFFAQLFYDGTRFSFQVVSPTEEEAEVLGGYLELLPPSALPQ